METVKYKTKLNFRIYPKIPNFQKLVFSDLLSFGQNFKRKSCRYCFDLKVLFWKKSKFRSTFERKVDLKLSQIKKTQLKH